MKFAADGKTDDRAAIQAALNATAAGGVFNLPHGNYFIGTSLFINKSVTVDLNGSTLTRSADGTLGHNQHFRVFPLADPLAGKATIAFQGAIAQGATVLPLMNVMPGLVYIELGSHPLDPPQPHFSGFVRITAAGVIDAPIPFAINGTAHKLYSFVSSVDNTTIKNGTLVQTGMGADLCAIRAGYCRGFTAQNLAIVGCGFVLEHLQEFDIRQVSIANRYATDAGFYIYQCRNGGGDQISWSAGTQGTEGGGGGGGFVSLEDSASVRFGDVELSGQNMTISNCQDQSAVTFDRLTIRSPAAADMGGGNVGSININELHLWGDVISFDYARVQRLFANGVRLGERRIDRLRLAVADVNAAQSMAAMLPLPSGVYRGLRIKCPAGATGQLSWADGGAGGMPLAALSDQWTACNVTGGTGRGAGNVNNLQDLTRRIGFGGISAMGPAGQSGELELEIDYFPAGPGGWGN